MNATTIDTKLVARLKRVWLRCISAEERYEGSEAGLWRLVRASDRAAADLAAAERGEPLPVRLAPRTARNKGRAGLAALAAIGRVVARVQASLAGLAKARIALAARRAASTVRKALRRAVVSIVRLITPREAFVTATIRTTVPTYVERATRSWSPGAHVIVGPAYRGNNTYVGDGHEGAYTVIRGIGGGDFKLVRGWLDSVEGASWDLIANTARLYAPTERTEGEVWS